MNCKQNEKIIKLPPKAQRQARKKSICNIKDGIIIVCLFHLLSFGIRIVVLLPCDKYTEFFFVF